MEKRLKDKHLSEQAASKRFGVRERLKDHLKDKDGAGRTKRHRDAQLQVTQRAEAHGPPASNTHGPQTHHRAADRPPGDKLKKTFFGETKRQTCMSDGQKRQTMTQRS